VRLRNGTSRTPPGNCATTKDWNESPRDVGGQFTRGDLLSDMARKEGLDIARVSKSFANDVLLALSCREAVACS
jgi:hypothetical protein